MNEFFNRLKTDRKFLLLVVGLLLGIFFLPYIAIPGVLIWLFFKSSKFSKKIKIITTSVAGGLFAFLIAVSTIAYTNDSVAQLTVTEPTDRYVTESNQVLIKGTYTPTDKKVWINDKQIDASNGAFETTYQLMEGENKIEVEAGDWKRTEVILTVIRNKPTQPSPTPTTAIQAQQDAPQKQPNSNSNKVDNLEYVKVTKVVDGDTIQIEGGKTVRYIGIDTPETVDPRKTVQCYGKEAANKNKQLVEGATIGLEKDVSETDRYGRLLRYVYKDGVMVNLMLVSEGYAYASSYPPDIKYQEKLRAAEQEARNSNKGLWSACTSTPAPTAKTQLQPQATATPASANTNPGTSTNTYTGGDKDCGDFSTQSEAQAFFISQGGPSNDPHKLDQDKDGVACETLP
jgi:micrococcal nuclease